MSAADTNDAWSKVYHEQFVCGEALFECGTERLNAVHFVVKDNTDAGYHTVAMEEKMVLLMSEFEASINAREQTNLNWRTIRYLGIYEGGHVVPKPCPDFHSEVLTPVRIRATGTLGCSETTLILPLVRLRGSGYSDTPPDPASEPMVHVYVVKSSPRLNPAAAMPPPGGTPLGGLVPPVTTGAHAHGPLFGARRGRPSVTGQRSCGGDGPSIGRTRRYRVGQADAATNDARRLGCVVCASM